VNVQASPEEVEFDGDALTQKPKRLKIARASVYRALAA